MFKLHYFLLAAPFLISLTQCNKTQDKHNETTNSELAHEISIKHNLIGEWDYDFPFYSSELILKNNGTFTFHDQGCTGQSFSEGHWIYKNDTVTLTSYDIFKKENQIKEDSVSKIKIKSRVKKIFTNGKSKSTQAYVVTVASPIVHSPDDTIRVYLDKVYFQLIGDTLHSTGKNDYLEDTHFYRRQK